jgi:predicted enzyme related to lactoylglutathione lyase
MELRLIVIRTADPKRLSEFYTLLGITFDYHQHGQSPFHYSAKIEKAVLEIYPLSKNQEEADRFLRLGFTVLNFDQTLELLSKSGVSFSEPFESEFGYMTILTDPDGRKVELYKGSENE